jgi:hypothetical protein
MTIRILPVRSAATAALEIRLWMLDHDEFGTVAFINDEVRVTSGYYGDHELIDVLVGAGLIIVEDDHYEVMQ